MRAIVVEAPGDPDVLRIQDIPRPEPKPGRVLIQVKAFGLNRAELYTRQGFSGPAVPFPRVIGIECVGVVAHDPAGVFQTGARVATLMGGMGRAFDGSYAEYTLVPAGQVLPIETDLDWATFAAIPEMFQTALGSLKESLRVQAGRTLLIRGGTSSVGLAAATLAKHMGLTVIATTRKKERENFLRENGADRVLIENADPPDAVSANATPLREQLRALHPEGVDYVLELVGTRTLSDSLALLAPGGVCCMTGSLAGEWELDGWNPMAHIRNGTCLTAYSGENIARADLQAIVDGVRSGSIRLATDRVFRFEEIVAAHRYMENNEACGKCVVVLD